MNFSAMRSAAVASALFWGSVLATIKVDLNDTNSIEDAAKSVATKSVATNLLTYYDGNKPGKTPGILPGPPSVGTGDYYWAEAGQFWDTLISYWRATGDTSYDDLVTQGIMWQLGPGNMFMPPNQTATLGNDDQGMWAMAAMSAAEANFTNPSAEPDTQWLAIAQRVFEGQAGRWTGEYTDTCGGGMRWQIPMTNAGFDFKNSASTGVFFNLAARLAHLTGNSTYSEWAETTWSWMETVGFLTPAGDIYDGASTDTNCTDINRAQYSYNLGIFIQGAAHMYNATSGADAWQARLKTLVNSTSTFTPGGDCVPVEIACEASNNCNTEMIAFKGVLIRGLYTAVQQAPFVRDSLSCVLESSVKAVATSCGDAGADKGAACGFVWTAGKDDGSHGAGQQMNALAALSAQYALQAGPARAAANGTSETGGGSPTQSGGGASQTSTTDKSAAGRARVGLLASSAVAAVLFGALLP